MSTNDPDFYQAPKSFPDNYDSPRQRGCFFYGCIIASVMMVLMIAGVSVVGYLGWRMLGKFVEEYTAQAPMELPKLEMSEEARAAVYERYEAFKEAVDKGLPTEPLVLTSDDLNALIEHDPDWKGTVYAQIQGDKIKGQVSFPLERIGLGMFKGRYLNGEAELRASLSFGVLIVTLNSLEVNGKKIPEEAMQQLRQENLAKNALDNPKNAAFIRKLDTIQIKDGKIVVTARTKTRTDDPEKPSGAPSGEATREKGAPTPAKPAPTPVNEKTKAAAPAEKPTQLPAPKAETRPTATPPPPAAPKS